MTSPDSYVMWRRAKATAHRCVTCVVFVVLIILFVPLLRNFILWPVFPNSWRQLTTWEVIAVYRNGVSGNGGGILRPCTSAAHTDIDKVISVDYVRSPVSHRDETLLGSARRHLNSLPDHQAQRLSAYLPLMTLKDKSRLLTLWRVLDHTLKRHNISYVFIEGSLLGVVRHQGMIPWDDDIDIGVWEEDDQRLQNALSCLNGYTLRLQDNFHYKFFSDHASVVPAEPAASVLHAQMLNEEEKHQLADTELRFQKREDLVMRYPFIDIFILRNHGQLTSSLTSYVATTTAFKTEDILPLTTAEFEGYLAPVPRRGRKVLDSLYNFHDCKSPMHNHRLGVGLDHNSTAIPCSELNGMYPMYGLDE